MNIVCKEAANCARTRDLLDEHQMRAGKGCILTNTDHAITHLSQKAVRRKELSMHWLQNNLCAQAENACMCKHHINVNLWLEILHSGGRGGQSTHVQFETGQPFALLDDSLMLVHVVICQHAWSLLTFA